MRRKEIKLLLPPITGIKNYGLRRVAGFRNGQTDGKEKRRALGVTPVIQSTTGHSPKNHLPRVFDQDTTIFIEMAQEMKDEGNKLFRKEMKLFKLAGASPTDIAVMIKNHCANESTQEGLSFNIEEIVQAWNEMYDAKRWISGVPSFRLEPLF